MILRTAATRSELRPRISPISSGVGTGLPMTWTLTYLLYDSFGTAGAAEFQARDPRRRRRFCKGRFGLEVLEQYPVWPIAVYNRPCRHESVVNAKGIPR